MLRLRRDPNWWKSSFQKFGSEAWIAVGDACLGNAVKTEDVVAEESGELDGAVAHFGRNNVNVLGETIDEDADSIVALGCAWKTGHEVDGDGVPTGCRDGKRLEQAGRNEGRRLVELTAVACADVGSDVGRHAWPPNMSSKDVEGRVFALMT